VLVGNKIDLVKQRVVDYEEGVTAAKRLGIPLFFETSAKCNYDQVERAFIAGASANFSVAYYGLSESDVSRKFCYEMWKHDAEQQGKLMFLQESNKFVDIKVTNL
jgi:GTPase SAR1 family protein